jgi:hypothetical protein
MGSIRNLTKQEILHNDFPDQPEILTLEELENRKRLAYWYMRRAGMEPLKEDNRL